MAEKAVLLINLGTPDKPEVSAVRRYLREFLNDPLVIDVPRLLQLFLVNMIIIPFRVRNSTKLYQQLWTDKGSPLLIYLQGLKEKLQAELAEDTKVYAAMRYGNPSLKKVMKQIESEGYKKLTVVPLYPQYATSTNLSTVRKVQQYMAKWYKFPEVRFVGPYFNRPAFINAFKQKIAVYKPEDYDKVIFSYHGLPNRQINKLHPQTDCESCTCTRQFPSDGYFCYKASCYETSRLLAAGLNLSDDRYLTGFQSRLSKNWLNPFTDKLVEQLADNGAKRVLVAAPSFVSDCLETTVELGAEYKELFLEKGGEHLQLVESLNDSDAWVSALKEIIH